jgi:hypothetical protein
MIMNIQSNRKWIPVGILLVVMLLAAACAQIETTEIAGSAGLPTTTPTPEADPRQELGSSTWGAVFEDDTQTWYQFENEQAKAEVRDDKLVLTAKKANSFDAWSMSYPKMEDFYLEVVFTTGEECQDKDRHGILFRAPDPTQGYLYNVNCDGSYQLRKWDGEQFSELITWTADAHIIKGPEVTHRVGVWAEGDHFVLDMNGFPIGEASDPTYADGTFGVSIAAAVTEGFTVDVTEAKVWELPE